MITKDILKNKEYNFLNINKHLGKNVILLGLSGSYAYGTNNENSDIDIRGITLNRKSDLIGMTSFDQYVDDNTDTCIYGFNKMINLLLNCNPNTIELLGLNEENYLYLNDIGRELINNKKMFLSKRAVHSFYGYASSQLRRLQNALARDSYPKEERERHIFNSVKNALYDFSKRYENFEEGSLKIYIDNSEIYLDANLRHYPLRDYKNIWAEMNNIVRDYDKIGKRNKKKDDNHLNKHAMHLIRLFMMAIDILEKEEISTYRAKEKELLLDIRNGKFQKEDGNFNEDFYVLLNDFEERLSYAAKHTNLKEEPDIDRVEEFVMSVNERVVKDEI
ncbi:nucleotidyltransferase domain-containing protein [Clostridium felsineum]|uniref:nucleotidyltransferase domain-containing protein n=1 Tax=Clostridium felsineum TaxID=36839 RepID=UPI00214D34D8|nr:nucleotidyltransferase domain-containing protein [Clostridium felsineum]MCR3759239.1 nucleotidyltransferase domain-containing protein [Clostridium felsineum]